MESEVVSSLRDENFELKRALGVLVNSDLVRDLSSALSRINSGDYVGEEEFFKNSV